LDIDTNTLSLKELKDLQSQVVKAIATFEDRKKKAALAELEEKARAMGFSLSELTGATAPRKRTPTTEKYRDPENPEKTWSGRGRKPHWFIAALAAGKSPEDLAI
jgi:DNA-binding protein H-NS